MGRIVGYYILHFQGKLMENFFSEIKSSLFRRLSQTQVDGLNIIIRSWRDMGRDYIPELAYILATAYHETAHTMQPVREAYWKSEEWRKKNLRYYPWYGRGFVQLTWEDNYRWASERFAMPEIMINPDVIMTPELSANIMIEGMITGQFGKPLTRYISREKKKDYRNARRSVNIMDKASLIAGYADEFEKALANTTFEPFEQNIKTTAKGLLDSTTLRATGAAGITAATGFFELGQTQPWLAAALIGIVAVALIYIAWERIKKMRRYGI